MSTPHPLLLRQLQRLGLSPESAPSAQAWGALLERVSAHYAESDQERYLLERSLTISSREMRELHGAVETAAVEKLANERDRFLSLDMGLLCIAGVEGNFLRLTPAWERAVGWSLEELLGRPYLDFVHPDDREATVEASEQLARGAGIGRFVNRYRHKNGGWRWIEWTAAPFPDEGVVYAAARDITDERNRDRAAGAGERGPGEPDGTR